MLSYEIPTKDFNNPSLLLSSIYVIANEQCITYAIQLLAFLYVIQWNVHVELR